MKQSPGDQDLNSLLGPSKFSSEGFLGNDTRTADEIIADDLRRLEHLGVTKEQIVTALKTAYDKAEKALGNPVAIRETVVAEYYESRGKIPSPFRGDGMFSKGEVDITDKKTGKSIIVTALGINLIEKRDFFQGKGSRFRIEPDSVKQMLL